MKKITILSALLGLAVLQVNASPFSIVGERYIEARIGRFDPKDNTLSALDDKWLDIAASANMPVNEGLDVSFDYGYTQVDGSVAGVASLDADIHSFMVGSTFHFNESMGAGMDPSYFIRAAAGVEVADFNATAFGANISDNDTSFVGLLALGVDYQIMEGTHIVPAVGYKTWDFNDGSFFVGTGIHQKIGEMFFASFEIKYLFDNDVGGLGFNAGAGVVF